MTEERSIPDCIHVIGDVLLSAEESGLNPLDIKCAIACLKTIQNHCNRVDAIANIANASSLSDILDRNWKEVLNA